MREDEGIHEPEFSIVADDRTVVGAWRLVAAAVVVMALALFFGWQLSAGDGDRPRQGEKPSTTGVMDSEGLDADGVQRITDLAELPTGPVDHVEVAYFHRAQRCHSCIEAERLTRQTIDTYYADRVESAELSLVVADVEARVNASLAGTYDAWTSSLYLGVSKGGVLHVYSVADMWFNIGDEERFIEALRAKLDTIYGST